MPLASRRAVLCLASAAVLAAAPARAADGPAAQLIEKVAAETPERIFKECVARGLLTMSYASSFRLQPALTIDEGTARNGLAVLREVFDLVDRERWWQAP